MHSEFVGKLYREVLKTTDVNFMVVHAVDGYDEISLTGDTKFYARKNIQLHEPKSFGFKQIEPKDIIGGDSVEANAKILLNILKGKGTEAQNNVVLANAALAISLYDKIPYPEAIEKVKDSLYSGKALACLNALQNIQ